MRKGQVIATDLVISLILVGLAIGLVTQLMQIHYMQTVSTFENAKMHQIAIDAATIKYYNDLDGQSPANTFEGLEVSSDDMQYNLTDDFTILLSSDACVVSSRGTKDSPVTAYVCRGKTV